MSLALIVGRVIFYATIQISFASFILGSAAGIKTQYHNKPNTKVYRNYFHQYLYVAIIYSLGISLILWETHGWIGLLASIIGNSLVIIWVYYFYHDALSNSIVHRPKPSGKL